MKSQLLVIILICFSVSLDKPVKAQQILNGGFEVTYLDSTSSPTPPSHLRPLNWRFHIGLDLFFACNLILGEMTSDSYTGDWAIKLETMLCAGGPLYSGAIKTSQELPNSMFQPDLVSHVIDARPDQVSFYYKYNPVNGDTAKFEALLYNYPDSITLWDPDWYSYIDTVGVAYELIMDSIDVYTELIVNFEYVSTETPQYIAILFSTNHNGVQFFEPNPAVHAGTTLWIDDVELIYLNTSSENLLQEVDVQIYPNPVTEHFQVEVPPNMAVQSMQVHDFSGRRVKILNPQSRFHSLNELPAGMYFLTLHTEQGSVVKKLVKE